ncbi:hypothetical protein [Nocardia sp. NPDC051570]|uniref:hypothetical protein n=1 Tax=Nocardia sp. NPDC051570 TaxID=3364324 RepID=UPI0037BB1CFE
MEIGVPVTVPGRKGPEVVATTVAVSVEFRIAVGVVVGEPVTLDVVATVVFGVFQSPHIAIVSGVHEGTAGGGSGAVDGIAGSGSGVGKGRTESQDEERAGRSQRGANTFHGTAFRRT